MSFPFNIAQLNDGRVVYEIWESLVLPITIFWKEHKHWYIADRPNCHYEKQPDGWFFVQDGAFYRIRDGKFLNTLDQVEIDYDRYLANMIVGDNEQPAAARS